jgi:hypothetical protein
MQVVAGKGTVRGVTLSTGFVKQRDAVLKITLVRELLQIIPNQLIDGHALRPCGFPGFLQRFLIDG